MASSTPFPYQFYQPKGAKLNKLATKTTLTLPGRQINGGSLAKREVLVHRQVVVQFS